MANSGKPIIYTQDINVRFGDLDPYGHVNSPIYLDYVISSRWHFLEKHLNSSSDALIKKGLGFFIINSNINYRRSIAGTETITVDSWVSEVAGTKLTVVFEIKNKETLYSDGQLLFAIMDLRTMKPQALPDWVEAIFWD